MENIDQNGGFSAEGQSEPSGESVVQAKKTVKPRGWLAGVLALLMPGLGHLYLGLPVLAIAFWVGAVAASNLLWVVAIHVDLGWPGMLLAVMFAIGFYAWQLVDAVKRGRRMERRLFVVPWYMFVVVIGLWVWGNGVVVPVFGHYETFRTTASAMEQTLAVGDYIAVDRDAYRKDEVQRGDVLVFLFPLDHEYKYIKRCVGLPGDTILIVDKVLHVNGEALEEPSTVCFIDSAIRPRREDGLNSRDNFGPYVVPAGQYFVLGDNRDNSSDSRFWGCVPKEVIQGKVRSIYWSGDPGRVGRRME